ncbi:hypothetical protein AVEN_118320-1 [Araneus ventricosus]|uniref:Uncharacterized protein n=1 Tax=Araneus ventricosus TaxID=182803 RepID=A0A4Y2B7P7_ARAVE|nr:hypothetical protein AVEN_118320-1 [Araneus ventricosus]
MKTDSIEIILGYISIGLGNKFGLTGDSLNIDPDNIYYSFVPSTINLKVHSTITGGGGTFLLIAHSKLSQIFQYRQRQLWDIKFALCGTVQGTFGAMSPWQTGSMIGPSLCRKSTKRTMLSSRKRIWVIIRPVDLRLWYNVNFRNSLPKH